MSNRRKPRAARPAGGARPDGRLSTPDEIAVARGTVDQAERRGDATMALTTIGCHLLDETGRLAWSDARVERLAQVHRLGDLLPAWVVSRWILAQAVESALTSSDDVSRNACRRALRVAVDLSGLDDEPELHESFVEHDWFHRQVLLFEEGALDRFLRLRAAPELLARSDRVEEWAAAPMGGFTYVGATGGTATWTDLATGAAVSTPDIGAGCMLKPGLHAIGRLVPAGSGVMFESAPTEVPLAVAREVARRPSEWLDVLRGAGDALHESDAISHVESFPVATDVPRVQWESWLGRFRPTRQAALRKDGRVLVRAVLDRARRELVADRYRFFPPELGEALAAEEIEGWEPWACLATALLEPIALDAISTEVTAADAAVLEQLRTRVASPVSDLIAVQLARWERAA
jgi:hypothetical protein